MDVGHRISVDHCIRRAVICSACSVGANDDRRVLVDDDGLVRQRLRFRRIDIASDDVLDESFFVVGVLNAEAGNELVIEDTLTTAKPRRL